ncbi:TspO/MBR family protein [Stigmatella aurantiaca]|uniref:TspO n=1 Tax=Stigmatella aurantiaca (strain DW4/3-1) TaxID=378806 RepID=Q094L9_STIAD|nr:TspO/MBR family protein [Stigmatella aurantiaca]ADO75425.1 TspO/MBR family protein [Stigmatella aurantiaca DW4/3-1]EAU67185.1 TspO [Stigmatella aurantiaca DW4/3-1]
MQRVQTENLAWKSPSLRGESYAALAVFSALSAGAAVMGAVATNGATQRWYRRLKKPPFQPPKAVFGPVWTVLYGLIAVSGWRVWNQPAGMARSRALSWWAVQLGFNAAWSWLFFGKQRPRSALADVAALTVSVGGYMAAARKVDLPAAALVAPYLGWVCFASLLNEEIVRLNR